MRGQPPETARTGRSPPQQAYGWLTRPDQNACVLPAFSEGVAGIVTDMSGSGLLQVAQAFSDLGAQMEEAAADPGTLVEAVAEVAINRVPGADWASITEYRKEHFSTIAATHEQARRADAIQYDLGSGPCLDAIIDHTIYCPRDLSHDSRWPEYGMRVADEVGAMSMLTYRLPLDDDDMISGLNIYSNQRDAFDDDALIIGMLLATHGSLALEASHHKTRATNLERALHTSREIGTAIGVLMGHHKLTQDQAIDLLRITSQHNNRKLHDVAREVVETGTLPLDLSTMRPPELPAGTGSGLHLRPGSGLTARRDVSNADQGYRSS